MCWVTGWGFGCGLLGCWLVGCFICCGFGLLVGYGVLVVIVLGLFYWLLVVGCFRSTGLSGFSGCKAWGWIADCFSSFVVCD